MVCPLCNDKKFINKEGKLRPCKCLIQKKVNSIFKHLPLSRLDNFEQMEPKKFDYTYFHKFSIIQCTGSTEYPKLVPKLKYILLKEYMQDKSIFKVETAYNILEKSFTNEDEESFGAGTGRYNAFAEQDNLILILGMGERRHKLLAESARALIERRFLLGKRTWLLLLKQPSNLIDYYGISFLAELKELGFTVEKLTVF